MVLAVMCFLQRQLQSPVCKAQWVTAVPVGGRICTDGEGKRRRRESKKIIMRVMDFHRIIKTIS